MTLRKIISGGQTGADMGGLLAAKELGLETGGTAPGGYKTEKGRNLDLRDIYGLTQFGTYPQRTRINVRDSDATVIFGDIGFHDIELEPPFYRSNSGRFT